MYYRSNVFGDEAILSTYLNNLHKSTPYDVWDPINYLELPW